MLTPHTAATARDTVIAIYQASCKVKREERYKFLLAIAERLTTLIERAARQEGKSQ